jgi:hypothetical protein
MYKDRHDVDGVTGISPSLSPGGRGQNPSNNGSVIDILFIHRYLRTEVYIHAAIH